MNVIDVSAYLKTGGADLSIVIASPLSGDEPSLTRLLDKIQGYLAHIQSEAFLADAGAAPTPENTRIHVLLHPESASQVRDLLDRCHPWVNSNKASLVVRDLTSDDSGGT